MVRLPLCAGDQRAPGRSEFLVPVGAVAAQDVSAWRPDLLSPGQTRPQGRGIWVFREFQGPSSFARMGNIRRSEWCARSLQLLSNPAPDYFRTDGPTSRLHGPARCPLLARHAMAGLGPGARLPEHRPSAWANRGRSAKRRNATGRAQAGRRRTTAGAPRYLRTAGSR